MGPPGSRTSGWRRTHGGACLGISLSPRLARALTDRGYTVRAMKRAARRRRMQEARVALLNRQTAGETTALSADIDAAVAALDDADRTAILLRFHQGLEFAGLARAPPEPRRSRLASHCWKCVGHSAAGGRFTSPP